jgi:hypothetical protein
MPSSRVAFAELVSRLGRIISKPARVSVAGRPVTDAPTSDAHATARTMGVGKRRDGAAIPLTALKVRKSTSIEA